MKVLSKYLLKKSIIKPEEINIIEYGLTSLLFNSITIITSFTIGTVLHDIFFSIIFLLFYIPIRIVVGGYHCKTALLCFVSFAVIVSVLFSIEYFWINKTHCFLLLFILLLTPCSIHKNKQYLDTKLSNKNKTILILLISFIVVIAKENDITAIYISLLLNTLLLTFSHLKKIIRKDV